MLSPSVFATDFYFYLSLCLGSKGDDNLVTVWMVTREREAETATDLLASRREGERQEGRSRMDSGEEMAKDAEAAWRQDPFPSHLRCWAKPLLCWFPRPPCHSWTLSLASHLVDTMLGPAGGRSWKFPSRKPRTPSWGLWPSPSSLARGPL